MYQSMFDSESHNLISNCNYPHPPGCVSKVMNETVRFWVNYKNGAIPLQRSRLRCSYIFPYSFSSYTLLWMRRHCPPLSPVG